MATVTVDNVTVADVDRLIQWCHTMGDDECLQWCCNVVARDAAARKEALELVVEAMNEIAAVEEAAEDIDDDEDNGHCFAARWW